MWVSNSSVSQADLSTFCLPASASGAARMTDPSHQPWPEAEQRQDKGGETRDRGHMSSQVARFTGPHHRLRLHSNLIKLILSLEQKLSSGRLLSLLLLLQLRRSKLRKHSLCLSSRPPPALLGSVLLRSCPCTSQPSKSVCFCFVFFLVVSLRVDIWQSILVRECFTAPGEAQTFCFIFE